MTTLRVSSSGLRSAVGLLGLLAFVIPPGVAAEPKAFPTAEGFGATTVGGRGGRIIEVTNLNDSGPGSLRDCAENTGPRICVFRVSGTIQLQSDIHVRGEAMSYLTVAGHTSPGGVQLKGPLYGFWITGGAHDVIIRHLRVRQGGPSSDEDIGNAILIYGNTATPVQRVIVDHSSVAWGTDTMLQDYGNTRDVTFQWNLIAEGADNGVGSRGEGMHIGEVFGDRTRTSVHHNLFVHCGSRQPLLDGTAVTDIRQNVVYNWSGNNGTQFGGPSNGERSAKANFVNNIYLPGPDSSLWSSDTGGWFHWLGNGDGYNGGTKIYTSGNWGPGCPSGCANDWDNGFMDIDAWYASNQSVAALESKYRVVTPFSAPAITLHPMAQLADVVLQNVGAVKPSRDSLDTRLVNDVRNRTGSINDVTYGGPWPTLTGGAPPIDTDADGMPDTWETAHGLNSNNASDGPQPAANGYTNVENYLNELAGDPIFGITLLAGDLDRNGKRDLADVRLLIYMLIGQQAKTPEADLTGDGAVTLADVQALIKLMVGLP